MEEILGSEVESRSVATLRGPAGKREHAGCLPEMVHTSLQSHCRLV